MKVKDSYYIIPASFAFGAWLASIQDGSWPIGFISFSFLFFLSFALLTLSIRWAEAGRTLAWIVALAFSLRFIVGLSLYLALPIYGHEDVDDKAGFVFTDAHRRDDQAWELASSEHPILDAFSQRFAYDQYGGLLAFSAFVYRYSSPDAHRPLMLVLFSAFVAALGIPFLWKAVSQIFGGKVAWASAWIFALYPESVLLGSSAMREPYLLTFSALALWGFVNWRSRADQGDRRNEERSSALSLSKGRSAMIWIALGLLGMLLVSPAIALAAIIIFAGWIWFTSGRGSISWNAIVMFAIIFVAGLFFLSSSLNRSGEFDSTSPLHVINDWLRLAVKWDAYRLEEGSGWVQKIFDEGPKWIRLPFITIYGIFQPVLPATLIVPTVLIWKTIYALRALGWYAMLPMLSLSFNAATSSKPAKERNLLIWLSFLTWIWILLAALRGGGDQWDNPRYRTIMFVWQSMVAGYVWVWWRETRNAWFTRILAMEAVFLLVFTQWYASRYFYLGGQLPFAMMISLILGLWSAILLMGWWQDKKRA